MKCLSCDVILSDLESSRRYGHSEGHVDLCNKCFNRADMDDVNTYVNPEFEKLEWVVDGELEEIDNGNLFDGWEDDEADGS